MQSATVSQGSFVLMLRNSMLPVHRQADRVHRERKPAAATPSAFRPADLEPPRSRTMVAGRVVEEPSFGAGWIDA
jgi:hypothetical protein